jgi:hypothetical protein
MELNKLISKREASSLTKPYHVVKVTDIKPGALTKWRKLLSEKYFYHKLPSEEEIKKIILNHVKKIKQPSIIQNIENEYYMSLDRCNEVVVEYSDLEYEVYKVTPNVLIEKI